MDGSEGPHTLEGECKCHVVFIPKGRRKTLYGALRKRLGEVFRLAGQKASRIEDGHLTPDHLHMLIAIPPKCAVSQVIGFIEAKNAIHLARVSASRSGILWGNTSGRAAISCRRWGATER